MLETMIVCRDKCETGCASYPVPLGKCFSPPKLWPHDPTWAINDIFDKCVNATHFQRSLFSSTDGTCEGSTGSFGIPIGECVGPFGEPRPWGWFNLTCTGPAAAEW